METKPTNNSKNEAKPHLPQHYLMVAIAIARTVFGGVFIFSGFVKAVDPLGTTYKLTDYFIAFHWETLNALTTPLTYLLIGFEFILGICILLGISRRTTPILGLVFMGVMTPLTLYLAIANPVSDCGCFGDAMVITNWQTFLKNIVLLALILLLACKRTLIKPLYSKHTRWLIGLYTTLYIVTLTWVGFHYLPLLDFRPYKSGTDIVEAMSIPEDAERDLYETTLIYEKEGVKQNFTLESYPANDTTWQFVDTQNRLIKKGYQPTITEFELIDKEGEDIAPTILADTTYTFLLLSTHLNEANDWNIHRINETYDYAKSHNYPFYAVTASSDEEIEEWIESSGAEYPYLFMDETTIKTIARANPSMLLLKEGVIMWKRSSITLPDETNLTQPLHQSKWGERVLYDRDRPLTWLILIFTLPLPLLLFIEQSVIAISGAIKRRRERAKAQEATQNEERE